MEQDTGDGAGTARATFRTGGLQEPFGRDGYTVVPFLDDDQLAAVRAVFDELGRAPDDPGEAVHFGFFSQDATWKRTVREALRPIVMPSVEAYFDRHRLAYAMFITKWPGDRSAFGPHRDPWFVDETRFRSATLWCPLVDTPPASGPDNGSLHFVPGSHRFTDSPRIHDASALLFEGAEDLILDEYGYPARLHAGEAVVFDNGMIHYSYRNASEAPRTVLALGLVPAEAELLYLQIDPPDAINAYAVDSDYFIEHNPFSMAYGLGHYEPVARLRHDLPQVTEAEFRSWCDAAVERLDPARRSPQLERPTADLSSDAFCFVCGGREGLEDVEGPDHASVMLMCTSCAATVAARYEGREVPPATPEVGKPPVPAIGPRRWAADGTPERRDLERDGFVVLTVGEADPAGALAGAAARLGLAAPVVQAAEASGPGAGDALAVAWSVVDEAEGQRSWLLWVPTGVTGPVAVPVVAGSHRVDRAPRGPGFDPAWTHDAEVLARAAPVAVAPGQVLVLDPAVLHRPLTGPVEGAHGSILGVAIEADAVPQHVRRLGDGRVARYALPVDGIDALALYGDGVLPDACPVEIHAGHPSHPDAAAVLGELPAEPVAIGSAPKVGHRLRRWGRAVRGVHQGVR